MALDHITYHIESGKLGTPMVVDNKLYSFMRLLGFREIAADDPFEHNWKVRWFVMSWIGRPAIHFVETDDGEQDILMLGHFCVTVSETYMYRIRASEWLTRDSGSGRVWLEYANLRAEVRPAS